MKPSVLAARYAGFAVLATLANLGSQRLVLVLGSEWFIAAVLTGTAVGLALKYVLDKRWIFYDQRRPLREEQRKFSLYAATGVVTTLIFWLSESVFWWAWQTHAMRELGAVIGLTIGYVTKYQLDKRFVFARETPRSEFSDRQAD